MKYLDYVGFSIPNDFVVGYGMDGKKEYYRDLPHICTLNNYGKSLFRSS